MTTFSKFAEQINRELTNMSSGQLYVLDIEKDKLWETYLNAFPAGTNEIYKSRPYHDCSCCRHFVKNMGRVVSIDQGNIHSIWSVDAPEFYSDVSGKMLELVQAATVKNILLSKESQYGTKSNSVVIEGAAKTFHHFYHVLNKKFVNKDPGPKLSQMESSYQVFNRGLSELTINAFETALELIDQNSLYRGTEFRAAIAEFLAAKRKYDQLGEQSRSIFVWENINSPSARIRNTAIGTLLQDLSEGIKSLDACLKSYETVMAPANYKRPTAIVTKSMVDAALKTIQELGIEDSLYRRHAKLEDISVSDVLFVDRQSSKKMKGVADILEKSVKTPKKLSKTEEIGIDEFVANVLPNIESLEVLVENKHRSNFCNLIAPLHDSPPLFKWDSNFSWSYNGNIADSMKETVKKFGGNVDGVLRFSIQWNDKNDNKNDLDAHCIEPNNDRYNNHHIYFANKRGDRSGTLDVDIIYPDGVAVENIIYTNVNKMVDGTYQFFVRNFRGTDGENFSAEIEFGGTVYSYRFEGRTKDDMYVADVKLKNGQFTIDHKMPHGEISQEVYGLETQKFHKVNLVTISPNYWNGNQTGNKHFMFMLEGCRNPEKTRGFYNEFLKNELVPHRKVFEVLSGKMQCEVTDDQMAGLGFSSTQRAELTVRANGSVSRTLQVKF